MKNSEQYPKAHAKYVVRREGVIFTATPCYGMHDPWWVVRVMGEAYEAQPEPMKADDEWWPLGDFDALDEILVMRDALERIAEEGLVEGGRILIARRALDDLKKAGEPKSP